MPHQRGDNSLPFAAQVGPRLLREAPSREPPTPRSMHHVDFQRRHGGPRMVHLSSPVGGHRPIYHSGMIYGGAGPHPHSPAWYGSSSVASSSHSPHRFHGGASLSVASSGESLHEEFTSTSSSTTKQEMQSQTLAAGTTQEKNNDEDGLSEKEKIIQEAIRRHLDDDNSVGTNEADAASALLFATSAMRQAKYSSVSVAESKEHEGEEVEDSKADDAEATNDKEGGSKKSHVDEEKCSQGDEDERGPVSGRLQSSVPLKKRRKLKEFLKDEPVSTSLTKQLLHVSPLPSPSVQTRVAGQESVEGTVASPPRTADSSLATGFDMKNPQALHTRTKISDAAEISPPPTQVVIEHFPTVLHNVLSDSEISGNVVQWLPDGMSWKILRWDALRRTVLPKYFSKLEDEDGKNIVSIDGFLWHLAAWGFEEIQDGPNVGAYTHKLFRKDTPQLCRQMVFSPTQSDLESPTATKATPTSIMSDKIRVASQPHSILQVPSLASSAGEGMHAKEAEKTTKWREEQRMSNAMHSPMISYPSMAGHPMRHPEGPVFVNYRLGDIAFSDGWHCFPDSPLDMRQMGPALSGFEQRHRVLLQHQVDFGGPRPSLPIRSPPRVLSSRGALRLPGASPVLVDSPQRRASFPVSNRGKGKRISPAARIPSALADAAEAIKALSKAKSEHELPPKREASAGLQKLSEEVGERVAVAISKKTKRKLPLASSAHLAASCSSNGESGDEEETTTTKTADV